MNDESNIIFTSPGLVPHILRLGKNLVGCELGVCRGGNLRHMLASLPNVKMSYAVDPWLAYQDWVGWQDQDLVDGWKKTAYEVLAPVSDRICFIEKSSTEAAKDIPDASLDYIFIDGDHSYAAVLQDCHTYWPKIKPGGIFAGHDRQLPDVIRAVTEFRSSLGISNHVRFVDYQVWFWHKEHRVVL